ncbi:diphosphate--fructose-6-phosphate 1-phosphotransferase [Treponema parvum]|uniref:diphosphate--fructose-6-phosphate 1-phosphotransferase n=1 Tax=Treponema parvum TaxID=138851 RepID=UPI001AEC1831|nr:diphosphate--fructose-6-phosphate 1-phosphotransferase [Treponema parvum]QTQ15393.1 diphosphate--fructose-6-phosphate 1-phosphotransferase [Treponema parvum]
MLVKPNALYIQSGGPTAVINSSAYGVIKSWRDKGSSVGNLYAVLYGNYGLVHGLLYNTSNISKTTLKRLKNTPSMIFGSSRYRIEDGPKGYKQYDAIIKTIKKHNIHHIFYNGGDGSLRACNELSLYLKKENILCSVIFIPKTVDNDIDGIDHAPGFPSTARHINISITELIHDIETYDTNIIAVIEVMGRKTGWLAASTIAAKHCGHGPDLIYVPEHKFSISNFFDDIRRILQKKGKCIAVVAEGVKDEHNKYLFEYGNKNLLCPELSMGGITPYLTDQLKNNFSCKIRGIDLGLMQRCSSHLISAIDIKEASDLGEQAVSLALAGENKKIVYVKRLSSYPYATSFDTIPIENVINGGHPLPLSYINDAGNFIKESFLDYICPLIGKMPLYAKLSNKKIIGGL